jgi:cysteinyl-tRNA synthetase
MSLHLYNTKSRSIEAFTPLNEKLVTMYACGITVNNYTHLGHMRKYIGDDILRRTLTLLGYEVNHVMNITDVGHLTDDGDNGEDKLETNAKKEGKTAWEIAEFYTDYFHKSMRAVQVLPPTHETKATEHIPAMIALVETLIAKGFAYETKHAVYFDVSKDADYGKLSRQKQEDKEVAVRDEIVIDPDKRNPADFSLWFKRLGKFESHTMYWPSPWGDGFPGWHIECSAMSMQYLGETIDIHTGGIEHIPVHHENEIAQSECATGHEFVRFWVHHEMLLINSEKMSKSKGNFVTLNDILARNIDPVAVRLVTMQTSYRKPLNFTWDVLDNANQQLKKLYRFASHQTTVGTVSEPHKSQFIEALSDDLNTAKALAVVWEIFNSSEIVDGDKWATLLYFDQVLGLKLDAVPKFTVDPQAQTLIEKRDEARTNKDFTTSDKLRAELEALGYEVLDTPSGTKLM